MTCQKSQEVRTPQHPGVSHNPDSLCRRHIYRCYLASSGAKVVDWCRSSTFNSTIKCSCCSLFAANPVVCRNRPAQTIGAGTSKPNRTVQSHRGVPTIARLCLLGTLTLHFRGRVRAKSGTRTPSYFVTMRAPSFEGLSVGMVASQPPLHWYAIT